jgi:putative transposase
MHIVQRGHSRGPVFLEEPDYLAYMDWLKEGGERYGCAIHAYVLMTNHVHILATPSNKESIIRMMQYVGRRYVPHINRSYGTSGSIWEGRYKACLVQEDAYLLSTMRYIELNPVRAKLVQSPAHYRWSSYRCNGQGKADDLVTPHPLYDALGATQAARLSAYKALFKVQLDRGVLDEIRSAWLTGTPLGNDRFKEEVERKLGRKVGQARRGRPKIMKGASS